MLVVVFCVSTSTASLLSARERIYERFQEHAAFRIALERMSQISTQNGNIIILDDAEDDDLIDSDEPDEDVLLPETINVVGEITPDNGDDVVVEEDELDEASTIDIDGLEGANLQDEQIVDENGELEVISEVTVDRDGETGRTIDRIIEIIAESNGQFGTMLQRVVKHTYASGTERSLGGAKADIAGHVVVGSASGISKNQKASVVVVTANDQ